MPPAWNFIIWPPDVDTPDWQCHRAALWHPRIVQIPLDLLDVQGVTASGRPVQHASTRAP